MAGQVVLVVGASRGIGRAAALQCGRTGARVCVGARDAAALETVRAEIVGNGGVVHAVPTDVGQPEDCRRVVAETLEVFGRVDAVIFSAGAYTANRFLATDPHDFDRMFHINLLGAVHVFQSAVPGMVDRGFGRIVAIASTAGVLGSRDRSAYAVSKHALVGLVRCVAEEMSGTGVTANALCPGPVDSRMLQELIHRRAEIEGGSAADVRAQMLRSTGSDRFLSPREVAEMAIFLASPAAGGITGQAIVMSAGGSRRFA